MDFWDDDFYEGLGEAIDETLEEPIQQLSDDIDRTIDAIVGGALDAINALSDN